MIIINDITMLQLCAKELVLLVISCSRFQVHVSKYVLRISHTYSLTNMVI